MKLPKLSPKKSQGRAGKWHLLRIAGGSMQPMLEDGDFVLTRPAAKPEKLPENTPVLVEHPKLGRIVKLLGRRSGQQYRLRGCSVKSISADAMGKISPEQILGQIILRIHPSGIDTSLNPAK